jgi:hypothetical protein
MLKIDIEKNYPNIYSKLDEIDKDLDELRYFVVVDENYADIDDEELDVFDPQDYNYLVYITERLSNILTEDGLKKLYLTLDNGVDFIENFLGSEEDLYGIKSDLSEDELATKIVEIAENILKDIS